MNEYSDLSFFSVNKLLTTEVFIELPDTSMNKSYYTPYNNPHHPRLTFKKAVNNLKDY